VKRIISLVAVALAIVSVVRYETDLRDRTAATRFLADFDVPARHPIEAAMLPLVPAADLGAEKVSEIALNDAFGSVRLDDVSPQLRRRWLRTIERVDDELLAAREITLTALAVRPGWPDHWATLGQLEYASHRRTPDANDLLFWEGPLRTALAYVPGDDAVWTFISTAYLENWPELPDAVRARAVPAFRRALLDPEFASMAFPVLMQAVGVDDAIAMLPQEPPTLRAAFDALAQSNDMTRAATLYERWEAAEWAAREADLREIENRARLGDIERQRDTASYWLGRHSPTEFDTPAGREQELRVLRLAVNDRMGQWQSDPRAAAVRFFMNRRIMPDTPGAHGIETAPGGAVIAAVVNSLTGVPEPIRARARLLGGDVEGAQSLFERSDSAGSFEWTPFLLDLAAYRISQSSSDAARAALDGLAPAARFECDAVVVRRRLAALDGTPDIGSIPATSSLPVAAWSSTGSLALCVDAEGAALRQLVTVVDAPAPALVAWGWNDGRHGILQLDAGKTAVRVTFGGRTGRQTFFIRSLTGTRVLPGPTTIVRIAEK